MSEYTVPDSNDYPGLIVVNYYRHLANENVTEEGRRLACVLAWCVQWLHSFFIVADDVIDDGETRFRKPCWHKVPGIGLTAINDSSHLEGCVYVLLRKYFKNKACYKDLLELFHEATHMTILGQTMQLLDSNKAADFRYFTLERVESISMHKVAYVSLYLPAACSLFLGGITDEKLHKQVKDIQLMLGIYCQNLNDYADCYRDPATVSGVVGCDIENNRCSWLIAKAVKKASPSQLSILQDNYGRKNMNSIRKVIEIYNELDLQSEFSKYKEHMFDDIHQMIDELDDELPRDMFLECARKVYDS